MGSDLLGGVEGGGAVHDFERALEEGRVGDAAELAVVLARRRIHGVEASAARIERTLAVDGLEPARRIALVRELAMVHGRAGRFDRAFATMVLALSLAEEAGDPAAACDAELRGGFFAIQVRELDYAHDLIDNAERGAEQLGDELRVGFARVARGLAALAEGAADVAVELIADGLARAGEIDAFHRCFVLRQYARALVRAGRHEDAIAPLAAALETALREDDPLQLSDCLDTFAALAPATDEAARAVGAADTLRSLAASVRWADEHDEAAGATAALRCNLGYDRAAELAAAGGGDPHAVARAALAVLSA
jgi:hypothetical protein